LFSSPCIFLYFMHRTFTCIQGPQERVLDQNLPGSPCYQSNGKCSTILGCSPSCFVSFHIVCCLRSAISVFCQGRPSDSQRSCLFPVLIRLLLILEIIDLPPLLLSIAFVYRWTKVEPYASILISIWLALPLISIPCLLFNLLTNLYLTVCSTFIDKSILYFYFWRILHSHNSCISVTVTGFELEHSDVVDGVIIIRDYHGVTIRNNSAPTHDRVSLYDVI
jgi:hypothetical protein